ncbi:MAG: hypothetical protein A2Y15_04655 [Clostridiales bacterium GWF2_36_10]|nr:MAG: hypothetical protein A2Y15_04655 [Clostridiales bacterium GWF2_36_10]HAN20877.1 hypothetical protein [Clostridiales bacterium]
MKKLICLLLSIVLAFPLSLICIAEEFGNMENSNYYKDLIYKEIEYVNSLALPNSAIAFSLPKIISYSEYLPLPDIDGIKSSEYTSWKSTKIIPYFSAFAVLGLIQGCDTLKINDGKDTALNYINWYILHMNTLKSDVNGVKGTVYDYYVFIGDNGKIIELDYPTAYKNHKNELLRKSNYDSTDSYAAIFLELLYEYTRVFDNDFLNDKKELVKTLIDVINATYIKNLDLTGAKPDYMVAYLMDNCEVYKGYLAADKIFTEFIDDKSYAKECFVNTEKIKSALLNTFWDDNNKAFSPGVFDNGKPAFGTTKEDMKVFYPNATSQLFPVIFGLLETQSEKATFIYNRFNEEFGKTGVTRKDWVNMDCGDAYPWALIGRAAVLMNDLDRVNDYIKTINRSYIQKNHIEPYYCAEAGHILIILCELYTLSSETNSENSYEIESEINSYTKTESETVSNCETESNSTEASEAIESNETINSTDKIKNKEASVLPWILGISAVIITSVGILIYSKLKYKKT